MATEAIPAPIADRARLWFNRSVRVLFGLMTACLVALAVLLATGYRALIVHSGSMSPSIDAGDVVISKVLHPSEVNRGDVITFRDPSRLDVLVTHRVSEIRQQGGSFAFVTRGDRNGGVERWSVDGEGTVGRVVLRIQNIGYWLSWVTIPGVRLALVIGAALILAGVALRRIWFQGERR